MNQQKEQRQEVLRPTLNIYISTTIIVLALKNLTFLKSEVFTTDDVIMTGKNSIAIHPIVLELLGSLSKRRF